MSEQAEGRQDGSELSLVMPFLPVESKGGPFPDDAYVCGYEAGRLDALMESAAAAMENLDDIVLHEENAEQADLLAMRHGFRAAIMPPRDGWVLASFTLADSDDPPHPVTERGPNQ